MFSFEGFLWYWGIAYCITSTAIALFKDEKEPKTEKLISNSTEHNHSSLIDTYMMVIKILRTPSVQKLALILLTIKLSWAAYESVGFFKFLDSGVSNEKMIPLNTLVGIPIQTFAMMLISRFVVSKSTDTFIYLIPVRTIFALIGVAIIWITPQLISEDGVAPAYIYFVYLINGTIYGISWFMMTITMSALFVKVSDPAVGGTYMTLLNTIDNLGGVWPSTLFLWLVEVLTWRDCGSETRLDAVNLNVTQVWIDH